MGNRWCVNLEDLTQCVQIVWCDPTMRADRPEHNESGGGRDEREMSFHSLRRMERQSANQSEVGYFLLHINEFSINNKSEG